MSPPLMPMTSEVSVTIRAFVPSSMRSNDSPILVSKEQRICCVVSLCEIRSKRGYP